jgi:mycothiol synthase
MRRAHYEPLGLAPDEDLGDGDLGTQLAEILQRARDTGATAVVVEAEPVDPELDATLEVAGFEPFRTTLQLRRPLPLELSARGNAPAITTRPFDPVRDEAAWLAVNNRAFAWHPDQSDQTLDDLRAHLAEPWFRADGFLLHESETGSVDGFCWTKIHTDDDPPLGEIYVIGVDPPAHGRGLGRALVLAGLDWLAAQRLTVGMLYVEADNVAALALYASMGFTEHQAHRWWRRTL